MPKDILLFLAFCFQAIKKKNQCFIELRKPQPLGTTELTTTLIFCIYCTVESSNQVFFFFFKSGFNDQWYHVNITSKVDFRFGGCQICSCCPKIWEFRSRIITRSKLHRVYCEISLSFLNSKEISMTESSLCVAASKICS